MSFTQTIHHQEWKSFLEKAHALHTSEPFPFSVFANPDVFQRIKRTSEHFMDNANHIVFCGIGGSSLSGQALTAPLNKSVTLSFLANIDPYAYESWDWSKTHFVFTSKSGGTVETLAQLSWITDQLTQRSLPLSKHCLILTQPHTSPLRTFAQDNAVPIIDLDPHVPGRFSAFTPTGLVPIMCAGGNALEALDAAYAVYASYTEKNTSHAITDSVAWILWNRSHKRCTSVLMPYAQKHAPCALWWRQLWAESLGKNGLDFLPVDAYGTVDQHSQLQLYLDGASSRFFTLIFPPQSSPTPETQPLATLLHQSCEATCKALIDRQRPVRTWEPKDQNPLAFTASFMMHCFLETILLARSYHIDPFNQPAVELIKKHLRSLTQ
ncbi:MAG: hypothetical protein OXC30_03545 [Alphaproteobacteria bacterium]|nr:hypothetical protein [Alphaproteobacteria bacterium]